MTTPQEKTGSGWGARTTAHEVVAGLDLTGRTAVVTGGAAGLGLETTRALSASGAEIVVGARRPAAARSAVAELPGVRVAELDLADLTSVRSFAEALLTDGRPIDMLIGSAGVMACPQTRVGPGWEAHLAINHLGHFALANRLWPVLAAGGGARVVAVSSAGHHGSAIRWDDPHLHGGYDKWLAYAQSKTANALFALHLDTLGRGDGVRGFSLHPGKILTGLVRHLDTAEMAGAGWVDEHGTLIDPTFKTPGQGAATQVWAAASPQLTGLGGVYCEDVDVAGPAPADGAMVGVAPWACDPDEAGRLWALSAELTGVDTFPGSRDDKWA